MTGAELREVLREHQLSEEVCDEEMVGILCDFIVEKGLVDQAMDHVVDTLSGMSLEGQLKSK